MKKLLFKSRPLIKQGEGIKIPQINKSHQIILLLNHYNFPNAHGAQVGKIEKLLNTEVLLNLDSQTQNHIIEIVILNYQVEWIHYTGDHKIFRKKPNYNYNNKYTNNSRSQSTNYNSDGNHSQSPFSRNCLCNVRSYKNSLLDQEQMNDTTSNMEPTETQNVSEEQFLEQQFNDLLLELNQETKDECFICQEECNTLTEESIHSTLCKSNNWVLQLTIHTKQTLDHL